VWDRSHYEEVLVVRVHPELLAAEQLPPDAGPADRLWPERFEDINAFEHHVVRSGTRLVKCFLHLSQTEQRRRFLARLDDPAKRWKFTPADLREREHFDEYQVAYEEAITATSTSWAPWYVIPADHKPTMRVLVAGLVADAIDRLDLRYPEVDEGRSAELEVARRRLESEDG
jgi:polyphosphate kinase 2 (PPK2 family)